MSLAIEANGLTKDFEKGRRTIWQRLRREADQRETFRAVDHIDLRVAESEVFGLLGPNGAGKTTTMRMLATLLEPTSGTATILGHDLVRGARDIRRRLGAVLSGERSLYWKLTARENLEYFAALDTRPLLPLPLEWVLLGVTSVALLVVGRWAWLATEHRLRRLGTLGQH